MDLAEIMQQNKKRGMRQRRLALGRQCSISDPKSSPNCGGWAAKFRRNGTDVTIYQQPSDFHNQKKDYHPILYENAGLYTKYLLDSYVDYKVLWKRVAGAIDELEINRATIELAQPREDICKLAKVRPLPVPPSNQKAITGSGPDGGKAQGQLETTQGDGTLKHQDASDQETTSYTVFQPTFAGLIEAR